MQLGTQQKCLSCWRVYFGSEGGGGEICVHIPKYISSLFPVQPSEPVVGNEVKGLLDINLPKNFFLVHYESFHRKVVYNNII